jgi:trans-aconitate 2-methyltransferase
MVMWDVTIYRKYASERARPFIDLLNQIDRTDCFRIVDLGCGTGEMTRLLADRWPQAHVLGVDDSPQMLEKAAEYAIPGRLEFIRGNIDQWTSEQPIDLLFSNAALQWLPNHSQLFPRLASLLAPRGTLALQMPNRFRTASQNAIEKAVGEPRWQGLLSGVGLHQDSVQPLDWYVRLLMQLGFEVNAWETNYYHVMTGDKPVLEWLKGTALRPLLALLKPAQSQQFQQELGDLLEASYPAQEGVTIFPMPRVFLVAHRGE